MKFFLKKIINFTLAIVTLIALVEIIFSKLSLTKFDIALSKSIADFEEVSNNIDILFLGDSRTYYGINPITINSKAKIHNFSFTSEPIQTSYWKIKYYFDNKKLNSLKAVYILFDQFMISSDTRIGLQTSYDYSKFYNYYVYEITKTMSLNKRISFWFNRNSNIIRLQSSFKGIIKNMLFSNGKKETLEKSGFSRRTYNIKRDDFEIEKKLMISALKPKPTMHVEPVKYYHKLVDLLTKNNINVFFYNIPSTPILLLKKNRSIEKYFRIIWEREEKFIKSEFPNLTYNNFNKKDIEWKLEDFSDSAHLNSKGAYKLGKIINFDLKSMLYPVEQD